MQSKKTNQLNTFSDILENKDSIFFISANNFTINEKTLLKSELNNIGKLF
jgi:ribosomal protein L10